MTNKSRIPGPNSSDMRTETKATFRPNFVVNVLAGLPKEEGYVYKGVIMNYKHLPLNVDNHEKDGYEIVYDTFSVQDDRKFSPNTNQEANRVPSPVIGRTGDGYDYVVMKISKEKERENALRNAKRDKEQYKASVGGNIKRTGKDSVHIQGGEINFDK